MVTFWVFGAQARESLFKLRDYTKKQTKVFDPVLYPVQVKWQLPSMTKFSHVTVAVRSSWANRGWFFYHVLSCWWKLESWIPVNSTKPTFTVAKKYTNKLQSQILDLVHWVFLFFFSAACMYRYTFRMFCLFLFMLWKISCKKDYHVQGHCSCSHHYSILPGSYQLQPNMPLDTWNWNNLESRALLKDPTAGLMRVGKTLLDINPTHIFPAGWAI